MSSEGTAEIVVVDDEADLREAVAGYLARQGMSVRAAAGGAELRAMLAERAADAVILDIAMPGEDGLSIARSLRAQGDIGIVMLTAAADVVDRVVGLEVGADDYIAKPFDLRELLARLRAVLRRRAAARGMADAAARGMADAAARGMAEVAARGMAEAAARGASDAAGAAPAMEEAGTRAAVPPTLGREVRMGRNRLCLDTRRLIGPDGFEVPLAASEFELLRTFAERPGRTLTREMLLELAHPHGEDRFDRSIDVRITRIRKKIESVPSRPQVIRTVRGIGYVFDPNAER